jgi:hypothetical protein
MSLLRVSSFLVSSVLGVALWTLPNPVKAVPERGSSAVASSRCESNGGTYSTKASLAAAMARELGRLDPATDLTTFGPFVTLSSQGWARCTNGCPRTRAILDQQLGNGDERDADPAVLRRDLTAALECHRRAQDTARRQVSAQPPAHKLTEVAGPIRIDPASCGPHYIFQADDLAGQPLGTEEATRLEHALDFFGAGACGSSPYLGFQVTRIGCPPGRTCIAIDPTREDGGAPPCPNVSYPLYDTWYPWPLSPGCSDTCTTPYYVPGHLASFASSVPSSAGWLYCVPFNTVLMLRTDVNGVVYGLNAYGGAYEYCWGGGWVHTPVAIHSQCWNNNPDCLWIYRPDRMIVSYADQTLAINAWGGAGQDVQLVLTRWCTPDNPDCTWSWVGGQLVSDRNPNLKFAVPWGGFDGSPVRLRTDANAGPYWSWERT